jgi:hypothetical protein
LHGFEDTDPKFEWPFSIHSRIDSFKRPSELFDKQPCIVDQENGMENFDLITPNEHLFNSESMRWIISQIQNLWDICCKDMNKQKKLQQQQQQQLLLDPDQQSNSQQQQLPPTGSGSVIPNINNNEDVITNRAVAAGRMWRPWEHIYAINKVVKGPFIPVYNPYGKYAVRLYYMVRKLFFIEQKTF